MPRTGGAPARAGRILQELAAGVKVFGAGWGRTNQIVFARQAGGLWQVSAAGGTPTAVTALQNDSGEVSQTRKVLIESGADARFVATGHLVYLRRGMLMAVPFDPQRLEVTTGAVVGLVADVMQAASIQPVQIDTGAGQFAISESGSLVYVTGGVADPPRWADPAGPA